METTSLWENITRGNLNNALCSQFAKYSQLIDLIPPGHDKHERREWMLYSSDSLVEDQVNNSLDANALFDDPIHFRVDLKARKVVAPYPFQNLIDL